MEEGRRLGVRLPDVGTLAWVTILSPRSMPVLRLVTDLGPGETEVLALALETEDPIVILDDALARRAAEFLGLRLTGTLGVLLGAKRKGVIPQVAPVLTELHALNFRVAAQTRAAVLKLASVEPAHSHQSYPIEVGGLVPGGWTGRKLAHSRSLPDPLQWPIGVGKG